MSQLEQFFTRERANEGIKVPLFFPDGRESEHWIQIRGVDADVFRTAEHESRRRIFSVMADKADPASLAQMERDEKIKVTTALVIAWSFEQPCTEPEVRKFLTEAPQIADQIDRMATRRALFFAPSSKPSTSSPAPTSS